MVPMFAECRSGVSAADIPEFGDSRMCIFALGCEYLIRAGRGLLTCHVESPSVSAPLPDLPGLSGGRRRGLGRSGAHGGRSGSILTYRIGGRHEPRGRDFFRFTREAMNELTCQTYSTNDDHLVLTLMTVWALGTGRAMPGSPPGCLSEQQLIDFWAE